MTDYNQKWKLQPGQKVDSSNYEAYKNEINRRYVERLIQNNERTAANPYSTAASGSFVSGEPSKALGANPEAGSSRSGGEQPALIPSNLGGAPRSDQPQVVAAPVQTNIQAANVPAAQSTMPVNPNRDVGVLGRMAEPGNPANRVPAATLNQPATNPIDLQLSRLRNAGTLPPEYGVAPGTARGTIAPPEVLRQNVYSQLGGPPTNMGVTTSNPTTVSNAIGAGLATNPEGYPTPAPAPLLRESMPMWDEGSGRAGKPLYAPAQNPNQPPEDLNGDGKVDLIDTLLGLFGARGTQAVNTVRENAATQQQQGTSQAVQAPTMGERLPEMLNWLWSQATGKGTTGG